MPWTLWEHKREADLRLCRVKRKLSRSDTELASKGQQEVAEQRIRERIPQ